MKKVYAIACNIQARVFFATRLGKGLQNITRILLLLPLLWATQVQGQNASQYTFSQSTGTYTPITGGTNLSGFATTTTYIDENLSALCPIGFNFTYCGTSYTQFGFDANGSIMLGANPTTASYTPISGTPNNVLGAMGADLICRGSLLVSTTSGSPTITVTGGDISLIQIGDRVSGTGLTAGSTVTAKTATTVTISANATSSGTGRHMRFSGSNYGIRYETIGTAPNRVLVVQWTGMQRFTTSGAFGELYNFQIRLTETSNTISFIYDIQGPTSTTSTTFEIGLRGTSSTDFNNRTTTSNWSSTSLGTTNASKVTLSNTVKPASGLTFTWTPPPPCTAPISLAATVTSSAQTFTTISGSFTAATTPPTGYLVIRTSTNTQPTPANNTTYTVGNNAIGFIEYVGTSAGSWTSTGLANGTTYYYWVFSYNTTGPTCFGGPVYSTSAATLTQSTVACTGSALANLTYSTAAATYCSGNAIAANAATLGTTSGSPAYTVSPSLPTGLSLNASTGAITGTPTTAQTATNYTITADNGCTNTNTTISIEVLASPAAPVSSAGTSPLTNGFTANWTTASGAASYVLDVATENTFTNIVSGYNALNVGNVITYNVTGVGAGRTYFYRVRSVNGNCISASSSSQSVTTTVLASSATGNWNVGTTWASGNVPTCEDVISIANGHNVTVNSTSNVSRNLTIASGGTLTIASGDLTVGCTLNNTPLTNNGTLTVSGGTLNVNGNISSASGSIFNQSGGNINIDGNNGGSATGSVASGTALLQFNQLNSGINLTGGTLTIIDPHANSTLSNSIGVSNSTAGTQTSTASHTLRFGDGISTDAGGNVNGFRVDPWTSTAYLSFGNIIINGSTGTNRSVTCAYQLAAVGDVTVTSGSTLNLSAALVAARNVIVNTGGTFINLQGIASAIITSNTSSALTFGPSTFSQTIGGSGIYQNLVTSPSANLTSLTINNTSSAGVTISAPLSISGTLTMTAGRINTTATNLLTLGTTAAAGTLTYTAGQIAGPFARTFAANRTAAGTYDATTLFPVGDGTNYIPIHIDPSTSSSGALVMRGQAFNTNSGTAGVGVSTSLSTDRWEALAITGSSNLTNCFIGLNDAQIAAGNIIAQATTAGGTYNTITPTSTVTAGSFIRTATAIAAADYAGYFTYAAPGPRITSFTPTTACPNAVTTITITGTNLGSATSVTLNGEACTITNNTATSITVTTDATPQAGNIVVTTAANSATSASAMSLFTLPTVTASSNATNNTVCSGTSVTLNGGGANSYTWNNGVTNNTSFTPTSTTTYTVTGTDGNGCTNTASISITVNQAVAIGTQPGNQVVLPNTNATFSLAATGTGLTYQWERSIDNGINWSSAGSQTFGDNASNYGSGWNNGSNEGSGFSQWAITTNSNTGIFISNPANDGMGTTGIGTNAFGVYATGSNYANINRPLATPMEISDTLIFWWAMNWDANGGNKGFDIKASGNNVFNINNSGNQNISSTNGVVNTNYGTSPMKVTIIRTGSNSYSFSMTSRSGGPDYNTTFTSTTPVNEIGFYIGGQNNGANQRNIYFNNFSITKGISGANTATLTVPNVISAQSGNQYRCVISGTAPCAAVTSSAATLTISTTAIATHPQNQTICSSSGAASFSISTSGTIPTYQWQLSTNNGVTWNDITGETNTTISLTGLSISDNGNLYRCMLNSGQINSNAALLTVSPPSVSGTPSANQGICSGNSPANITLTGNTGAIQWQSSTDNITFNDISSATASPLTSLQMGSLTATRYYRAVVTSGACAAQTSNVITVTVTAPPVAGTITGSASICANSNITFTSNGNTGGSWSSSATGVATVNASTGVVSGVSAGSTVISYTVTGTGGCSNSVANFNASVISPNTGITATATATPATICAGNSSSLSLAIGNPTLPTGYCTIPAATSTLSYFNSFSTTGGSTNITNSSSGFSTSGYGNFTNLRVVADRNQVINFNTALVGTTVGVAIWVDWNQNGTFESTERMFVTSGFVSTAASSFTVPSSAQYGITRMRILMDYNASVPANPCAFASGRGEVEDYTFQVMPVVSSYNWTDGTSTIGTTNPLEVSPTSATTYTGTATVNGCPISASGVVVSVNQLPAAPTADIATSTQCGAVVPTVSVSGTASQMRWYNGNTAGATLLQTGGLTYASSISATTTFYVGVNNGTCETAPANRTALTVTVNTPDAITASASVTSISCLGTSTSINVSQTGSTNTYSLAWTLSSYTGSGLSGSTSATLNTPITVTPTAAGSYTYIVTGTESSTGCVATSNAVVTVSNPNAGITATATATQAAICRGSSSSLSVSVSQPQTGGRNAPASTSSTAAFNYGLVFDVTTAFTLNSIVVYNAGAANTMTLVLQNSSGTQLQTLTTPSIPSGTGTTPTTVNIGWLIPVGTGYRLLATSSPNLVRESSLGGFPYSIGSSGSITSGFISGVSTTYYYFYNWSITATITPTSFAWSDGTSTVGSTNPLIVAPTSATTYTGTATVNGCPLTSNTVTVNVNQPSTTLTVSGVPIADGNYLWNGNSSSDVSSAANWYVLNSGTYNLATQAPSSTNDVFIVSSGSSGGCVSAANNASISANGTLNANNFYLGSSASFSSGAGSTLNISGNFNNNGTYNAGSGTVIFNGSAAAQNIGGTSATTFSNLTFDNANGINLSNSNNVSAALNLANGTLSIGANTLTLNGSISRTSGNIDASNASATVLFGGSAAQSIPASTFSGNINNLTLNNSAGLTAAQSLTIANALTLTSGTFTTGATTLTLNGSISRTSGNINASNTSATVLFGGSAAQTIPASTFTGNINNLTLNNSAGLTTAQSLTIANGLTLTSGTFTTGATTLTLNGSISRTSGNIDASNASATVLFGGSAAQSIPSSTFSGNINNLTVNNSAGLTSDQAITVNGTLTLTAGVLNMGANLLTVASANTGAVSRTSGYVSGPVALTLPANMASGSTYLFPLGKAAYTPFALVNPTTNTGGSVVIRAEVFDAATGGSAGAGLSSINTNRYWDVSISSGASNFINTSVRATESAIGTFNRLANNATTLTGTYAAVSTAFPSGNSITSTTLTNLGYFVFAETIASLTEIYMPQFMQGKSGTNDNRIPHIFRATLTNLYPSTTYRYFNAAVTAADAATSNGAGNPIFINSGTSTLTRSTAPDLSSSFGSFTTDANGTYTGWFMLEPTGDARFDVANSVFMRIMLNDGNGGTTVTTRITSTNAAKVIDLNTGSSANDGTAVYGGSLTNEKNMVVLFDNITGTGRPIAATIAENDGIANTTANGYASFYENNVNGTARRWGTIIPNANANGIKRIEYRNLSNGNMHYWVSDNDGNWDGTVNTVNPTGGSTPLVIPSDISDSATFASNTTTTLLHNMTFNGKVDIAAGANITINGFTLTLNDGLKPSSAGTLVGSATSSLIIGGVGNAGTLLMDQTNAGTSNALQRLVITKTNGTITLGNTLHIIDSVSVGNTNATLATGGNLVLISNATQTARVGRLGGTISGNVNVQRFIPAVTRRYRMISPNIQNFAYSQLIDDIFVTGTGGASNGFDASSNNNPTIYTYQESTTGGRGWKPVTSLAGNLSAGQGAIVFIRGDRTLPAPAWYTQGQFPAQNAVTLDFIENINSGASGAISPTLTYTNTSTPAEDGWNLVGNPYPSQIDWRLITKNNLNAFYYAFNPATNAYVASDGDISSGNNPFIASGQAFFVQATAASPSISFDENCKTAAAPTSYFKSAGGQITIEMIRDSLNSDIAFMQIKPGANLSYSGAEDARKYPNPDINFGYQISGTPVQINRVPPLTNIADTFILFANAPQGTYRLQVGGLNNIPAFKAALLRDLFTAQTTDLRSNGVYTFQITSNTSSSGNRFQLIIINQSALPVELISFTATRVHQTDDVSLNWLTANEKNNAAFVVERSFDGESFEAISTLKGAGNSNALLSYSYLDNEAVKEAKNKQADVLYYRLRQVDFSGESQISNVVSVSLRDWYSLGKNKSGISLYPNPATTEVFVSMANNGNIKLLEIFDVAGKRVMSIQNPDPAKPIDLYGLKAGVYLVKVNAQETSKLIIE